MCKTGLFFILAVQSLVRRCIDAVQESLSSGVGMKGLSQAESRAAGSGDRALCSPAELLLGLPSRFIPHNQVVLPGGNLRFFKQNIIEEVSVWKQSHLTWASRRNYFYNLLYVMNELRYLTVLFRFLVGMCILF